MLMASQSSPSSSWLLGLVSDDNTPLDQLAAAFKTGCDGPGHAFNAACALKALLDDQTLLDKPSQRITALYFLYNLYQNEPLKANPFLSVLVTAAETGNISEKHFLSSVFGPSDQRVFKSTARQLLDQYSSIKAPPSHPPLASLSALCQKTKLKRPAVSVMLPDPALDIPSQPLHKAGANEAEQYIDGNLVDWTNQSWTPCLARPIPPLLSVVDDEMVWLNPSEVVYSLQLDPAMCVDNRQSTEIRELMSRAFRDPLDIASRDRVVDALEADHKLVYHVGLMPSRLPDLVENNPILAIEALLKLMRSSQISEYLSVLVNMDMSLHSMEVVNRLTTAVDLPIEFVHLYISNCIHTCETVTDSYMQNRLVRLVCVFLQSLIRNQIINVQELFIEVQAFCIEFSHIREAAGLFRLLKTMDQGANETEREAEGETEKA